MQMCLHAIAFHESVFTENGHRGRGVVQLCGYRLARWCRRRLRWMPSSVVTLNEMNHEHEREPWTRLLLFAFDPVTELPGSCFAFVQAPPFWRASSECCVFLRDERTAVVSLCGRHLLYDHDQRPFCVNKSFNITGFLCVCCVESLLVSRATVL